RGRPGAVQPARLLDRRGCRARRPPLPPVRPVAAEVGRAARRADLRRADGRDGDRGDAMIERRAHRNDLNGVRRARVDALAALTREAARLDVLKAILAVRLASASNGHPAPPPSEAAPLTQEEAAERYRIPLRTIRRLTRTDRLPSTRVGRNRMIRATDLDR